MSSKSRRCEVLLPIRFNDGKDVPEETLGEAVNEIVGEQQRHSAICHALTRLTRRVPCFRGYLSTIRPEHSHRESMLSSRGFHAFAVVLQGTLSTARSAKAWHARLFHQTPGFYRSEIASVGFASRGVRALVAAMSTSSRRMAAIRDIQGS
jgi:hypothetical protein